MSEQLRFYNVERAESCRGNFCCTIERNIARLTPVMPTNNYIAVVEKAMRVLEALRGKREVPLGEIASSTGLIKSSTFRILFTFERLGYVEKSAGGRYGLTAHLDRLTGNGRPSPDLGNLAEPFMAELLRRFRETVNLGGFGRRGGSLYPRPGKFPRLPACRPRRHAYSGSFDSARQMSALLPAA